MVNQSNFLDLYDVLVNEVIGDVWLSIFIGCILITFICSRSNLPKEITITLNALWLMIIFTVLLDSVVIIWVLILLGAAGFFFYSIVRLIIK